ncbi:MAG TPA: BamA/TamA family outer membrane protein [Burkholderiaceae bacterium]|nr:BamA/TamA family outer membrane protein [Burkholderiaceae bacterium]
MLETNLDVERAGRLAEADSLDDSEWARLIAAVPAQAQALAQTQGYFRAEVQVAPDPGDAHRILIHVEPGPMAHVGRLTLQFDGELATRADQGDPQAVGLEEQLRSAFALPPGKPFVNDDWSAAKGQVLTRLRSAGYAAAQWTATSAQVDPGTDLARLFLVADSGPQFLAGDIVIEGLERQPAKNVRDLAGFGTGTPLTQIRMQDYQDRLQKTGLFDQAAVTYDPDPGQAKHATVTVHLHEQSLQQAQVALGYSSTSGPRVTLEHIDRRILGFPATLDNKLQYGRDIQEWDMNLIGHPAENFHSWVLGTTISRILTTGDDVRAGSIRIGRTQDSNPLDRFTFLQFERSIQCTSGTTQIEHAYAVEQPDGFHGNFSDCIDARALSINQHGVWRKVDNVILPTDGWTLSAQAGTGVAGGPDSAYGPYLRLYGRLTDYFPFGEAWFGQARLELGQIIVKDGVAMPDAEQWRAGGEDSVRGYAWRSLAPLNAYGQVVGGNALVTTSVEVAHPFTASLPSVWWATFVDAGRAATRFNDLKMALGYGVGLRWRSPVGPLRVDWSWGQEVHRGRLDLSVGIAF